MNRMINKFKSDRGIPLVTQVILNNGTFTVERYLKWYDFYVIDKQGTIHPLQRSVYFNEEVNNIYSDNIGDHCLNPKAFVKIANILGLSYDEETLNYVICMWIEQYLEYNLDNLNDYIPDGHTFSPLPKNDEGFFIF